MGEWRRSAGAAIKRFWNKYINFVQWYKKVKYYESSIPEYNKERRKVIRIYCMGMLLETMTRANLDFKESDIKYIWFDENKKLRKEIDYNGTHLRAPHVCVFMMEALYDAPMWKSKKDIKRNVQNIIIEGLVKKYPKLLYDPDYLDELEIYSELYNECNNCMIEKRIVKREWKIKLWWRKFKIKQEIRRLKKQIRSYSNYIKKYDLEKFYEILNNADTIVKLNKTNL